MQSKIWHKWTYLWNRNRLMDTGRRQWHHTPVLLPGKSHGWRSLGGCSPWGRTGSDRTEQLHFHFHSHALEKEVATHSSVLAWRIPGTGEPGGLPSMGSYRVRRDWTDLAAAAAAWTQNKLVVSKRERVGGWSGRLGLADANYIQLYNCIGETTKSYCIGQRTIFNILW